MTSPTRRALAVAIASTMAGVGIPSLAQDKFPNKPVNLLIPYGPGGPGDIIARTLTDGLARQLGQPVIPVNRAGGNSMIAIKAAQALPADGYNLLFLTGAVANEQILKNLSFDIRKDLIPVARYAEAPLGLFVSNTLPVNSVRELVAYAKQNPGRLTYASSGVGSIAHLNTARFELATGTSMLHVPYASGTAAVLTGLMKGDISVFITEMGSMKPLVADGRVKFLATLSPRRSGAYPDAPSMSEAGVPELRNYSTRFYFGVFVIAGTPADRVQLLNAAVNRATAEKGLHEKLVSLGYASQDIGALTPEQFRALVSEDVASATLAVQEAKIEFPK